jgi:ribose transport system ATP-binding protein
VLTGYNISTTLALVTATAFASYGQLFVVLTGGIDLSVGPLMGLLVVIASFYINDGNPPRTIVLGLLLMFLAALGTGIVNGGLVVVGRYNPVAATLVTYIALQGISLELRPFQAGYINAHVASWVSTSLDNIPVAFLIAAVLAVALDCGLKFTSWGRSLRAAGSQEDAAQRLGVRVRYVVCGAYVLCSLLVFPAGIMLMAQLGVGDPTQGVTYTLGSVAAVVLGGASLFGGRGSFVGALLGALLIQQLIDATTFLGLSEPWQYWFQGFFLLAAAAIYTRARRSTGRRSDALVSSAE